MADKHKEQGHSRVGKYRLKIRNGGLLTIKSKVYSLINSSIMIYIYYKISSNLITIYNNKIIYLIIKSPVQVSTKVANSPSGFGS